MGIGVHLDLHDLLDGDLLPHASLDVNPLLDGLDIVANQFFDRYLDLFLNFPFDFDGNVNLNYLIDFGEKNVNKLMRIIEARQT